MNLLIPNQDNAKVAEKLKPCIHYTMEDFNQHAADPIEELLTTYAELNSEVIDELHEAPSALEFMRYIAQNRPFVVRHGVQEWDAIKKWNIEYLKATLRSEVVNVAITPIGYVHGARWYIGL
jgi:hypothetical protein